MSIRAWAGVGFIGISWTLRFTVSEVVEASGVFGAARWREIGIVHVRNDERFQFLNTGLETAPAGGFLDVTGRSLIPGFPAGADEGGHGSLLDRIIFDPDES